MWENVGPALEDINPKLNPKTASKVDELLETEICMYVCPPQIFPIFSKYEHNLHNLHNVHNLHLRYKC